MQTNNTGISSKKSYIVIGPQMQPFKRKNLVEVDMAAIFFPVLLQCLYELYSYIKCF